NTQDGESLDLYFRDIASSKPLSAEEEIELARRTHMGDRKARDRLVSANLRFVVLVAREYQNRGMPLEDLIGAGNVGLMTAAERFDEAQGCKFISYAVWWIRQAILQTIAEEARTVRLPLNKVNLLKDISKAVKRFHQESDRDPEVEELAEELDLPIQEILDTLLEARTVRSLDRTFQEGEECSLLEVLPDTHQDAPDAGAV
ncbi:MAG: RNA polymerase sigma factor RpoD/SigA, partial [Candidatus Krumholzibacteria bacterium]|nr:RNA polymerase sigma factor RpoD/SigA [Candidatus Krumholzibacteria bacterium]